MWASNEFENPDDPEPIYVNDPFEDDDEEDEEEEFFI